MGSDLDIDDVAATSNMAQQELAELREQIGSGTNPRYLLWRVWHGDNINMKLFEYMEWNNKRLTEFCKENKRVRPLSSSEDNASYDAWLLHWVRHEIANKVAYTDAF